MEASPVRRLPLPGDLPLGILGSGHLGRALASALIASGLPPSRLLLCHRGSPSTAAALEAAGLSRQVVACDEIGRRCGILLVTLRPQEAGALSACPVRPDTLVVSFMAGIPLAGLALPAEVAQRVRVMPSAPSTIDRRNGIAGIYPAGAPLVGELCRSLSLLPIELGDEEALHPFTALGPCLPIALAYWSTLGRTVDTEAIARLAAGYRLPGYRRILSWALSVAGESTIESPGGELLTASATRGGVTQAILEAIDRGRSLSDALAAGVERSRDLQRTG